MQSRQQYNKYLQGENEDLTESVNNRINRLKNLSDGHARQFSPLHTQFAEAPTKNTTALKEIRVEVAKLKADLQAAVNNHTSLKSKLNSSDNKATDDGKKSQFAEVPNTPAIDNKKLKEIRLEVTKLKAELAAVKEKRSKAQFAEVPNTPTNDNKILKEIRHEVMKLKTDFAAINSSNNMALDPKVVRQEVESLKAQFAEVNPPECEVADPVAIRQEVENLKAQFAEVNSSSSSDDDIGNEDAVRKFIEELEKPVVATETEAMPIGPTTITESEPVTQPKLKKWRRPKRPRVQQKQSAKSDDSEEDSDDFPTAPKGYYNEPLEFVCFEKKNGKLERI